MKRCIGYLSGAPRVSTHPEADTAGARAHILGVTHAFKSLDWDVKQFIVGDRMPESWKKSSTAQFMRKTIFHRLLADLLRIVIGIKNNYSVQRELRQVDWVYERFAIFQALGRTFRHKSIPWILETQGLCYYEAFKDRQSIFLSSIAQLLEKRAYKECDVLICVTDTLKQILINEVEINPYKIVVVPNGVDTSFFDPAIYSSKKSLLNKEMVIGFVGSLIAWQGLDLLIEALYCLKNEGMEIGLVVVGNGSKRSEWESLTHKLELDDIVNFVGSVPYGEVPKYMDSFDICYSGQVSMQYGKMYGSPLKLYEYMSMAKPVIASAFDDSINTVVHGETGYLYLPENKESLKQVMRRAYNERNRFSEMGWKARKEMVLKHSWISRVEMTIKAVENIITQ